MTIKSYLMSGDEVAVGIDVTKNTLQALSINSPLVGFECSWGSGVAKNVSSPARRAQPRPVISSSPYTQNSEARCPWDGGAYCRATFRGREPSSFERTPKGNTSSTEW